PVDPPLEPRLVGPAEVDADGALLVDEPVAAPHADRDRLAVLDRRPRAALPRKPEVVGLPRIGPHEIDAQRALALHQQLGGLHVEEVVVVVAVRHDPPHLARLAEDRPLRTRPLRHGSPLPRTTLPRSITRARGICHQGPEWAVTGSNRRPPACKAPSTRG